MNDYKTIEEWASAKKTPAWLFAAVKVEMAWAEGVSVAESMFDAACEAVRALPTSAVKGA